MKRLFLTGIFIAISLVNYAQQYKGRKATCNNCGQDSINVTLLNADKNNLVTIDTASINRLAEKFNKSQKNFDLTKWFSLLLTVIGLPFIYFTFIRTGRFKNFDFLSEVDKQLIANPQLWNIYDKKKNRYNSSPAINLEGDAKMTLNRTENILFEKQIELTGIDDGVTITSSDNLITPNGDSVKTIALLKGVSTLIKSSSTKLQPLKIDGAATIANCPNLLIRTQTDLEIDDKIEAFCYYKLNNFENVFKNFGWVKHGTVFESWERYLIELMITSTAFNVVVDKAIKRDYLSERFSSRLVKYQAISKALKISHDKFEDGVINKEAFKELYKKEINKQFKKEIFLSKALSVTFILGVITCCVLIIKELINQLS